MTTLNQSVAELDRKIEENHSEVNSHIVQLRETVNTMNANMEELRALILTQN